MDGYQSQLGAYKKTLVLGIVVVLLLITALALPQMLYGDAKPLLFKQAPSFAGPVSQALGVTEGTLPVFGKDYRLENAKYFSNKDWVVLSIVATSKKITNGYVVLQKQAGNYVVAIGPGTVFNRAYTAAAPTDLVQYLSDEGILYDSSS